MASVPPFPGAAKTVDTFGLAARALTMACSRPPEPTTTTEAMVSSAVLLCALEPRFAPESDFESCAVRVPRCNAAVCGQQV